LWVVLFVDSIVDDAIAIIVEVVAGLDGLVGGFAKGLAAIFEEPVAIDVAWLATDQGAFTPAAGAGSVGYGASIAALPTVFTIEIQVEAFVEESVAVIVFAVTHFGARIDGQATAFAAVALVLVEVSEAGLASGQPTDAFVADRVSIEINAFDVTTAAVGDVYGGIEKFVYIAVAVVIAGVADLGFGGGVTGSFTAIFGVAVYIVETVFTGPQFACSEFAEGDAVCVFAKGAACAAVFWVEVEIELFIDSLVAVIVQIVTGLDVDEDASTRAILHSARTPIGISPGSDGFVVAADPH
jgi:hypothetical protein